MCDSRITFGDSQNHERTGHTHAHTPGETLARKNIVESRGLLMGHCRNEYEAAVNLVGGLICFSLTSADKSCFKNFVFSAVHSVLLDCHVFRTCLIDCRPVVRHAYNFGPARCELIIFRSNQEFWQMLISGPHKKILPRVRRGPGRVLEIRTRVAYWLCAGALEKFCLAHSRL